MLIPIGSGVGVTSVSLGMVRAMERHGVNVSFFKPVAQPKLAHSGPEASTAVIRAGSNITPPEPLSLHYAENMISSGNTAVLLEEIVAMYENHVKESGAEEFVDAGGFEERAHHLPSSVDDLRLGRRPILERPSQLNSALPISPCWR